MIKKALSFLIIIIFAINCHSNSSTIFLNNEYRKIAITTQCDPKKKFPQLIILPYFEHASQLVPNCQTYPVHKTSLALFIFYHQWIENFGDDSFTTRGMLQRVMIHWDTKKRSGVNGYDMEGEKFESDRNIIGLVETDSIIWVWQGYHHRISESSLIHELVHLALRAKNGEADADHEGPKYEGWTPRHTRMISETNQMLRAFEL